MLALFGLCGASEISVPWDSRLLSADQLRDPLPTMPSGTPPDEPVLFPTEPFHLTADPAPLGPPDLGLPAHCLHEGHCLCSRLTAKAVAVLLPILGTSWVFGVLAVSDRALVFQYMFAILNSLQVRKAHRPTGTEQP